MTKNADIKSVSKIRNKIYMIRGMQVMLDFDLAEMYGYTTKAFNQQVKNNIEKFEGEEFMFRLNETELRSIFLTAKISTMNRSFPYAFTEQGVYMLMTVLKGELATKQSRALIIAFKTMKDYILDNQSIINKTIENTEDILGIRADIENIKVEIDGMIKKSDVSPILLNFSRVKEAQEFLIMNGEVVKAKDTIIDIYNKAKKKIAIIDNYVSYKTLRLFLEVKSNLEINIYTNNTNNYLKKIDVEEFKRERPDIKMDLVKISNIIHDRFIILDDKIFYLVGGSSKDIGNKMAVILEITDVSIKQTILSTIK